MEGSDGGDRLNVSNRPDLESETVLSEPKNDKFRVYLRIKNVHDVDNLYEIKDNTIVCNVPPSSTGMRNMREGDSLKKMYTFTKIFQPVTSQSEIFNNVVKPKILDFINGQNSTLLTYGASDSGKTFTVIGTNDEPGLLPRSLEYLFRSLPQLTKSPPAKPLPAGNVIMLGENDYKKEQMIRDNLLHSSSSINTYRTMQQHLSSEPAAQLKDMPHVSLAVWVSFAEIYNEQVYDLLSNPPRGKQRERLHLGCSNGQAYIKNLTSISVTSGLEAYQILQHGIHNLNYAPTNLNSHSSRSHSIFTIKLVQISESDGGPYVSCFNFCDLAGCERTKKTLNVGERLQESNNINSLYLVLERCISAISKAQRQNDTKLSIPFRESKLTQLFQKALAGHEDIAMIVTISPKSEMFDETQHVLNFSAVTKQIKLKTNRQPRKKGRFSLMVQQKISSHNEEAQRQLIDEAVTEVDGLEKENEVLKTEIEDLRENCVIKELEIDTLQRRINDLEKENEALKSENEDLRKNCVDYKRQINTLKEEQKKNNPKKEIALRPEASGGQTSKSNEGEINNQQKSPIRYKSEEDILILEYIYKNNYIKKIKGDWLWKKIETENIVDGRSWQSMKAHFRRQMMPNIHKYGLSAETQKLFQQANE